MDDSAEELAAAAHMHRVVERANDAYVEVDEAGRISYWNGQAERTFGWAAGEVLGASLAEIVVPPAARADHESGFARMLARGDSLLDGRRLRLSALHRDGTEFPVELSLSAYRENSAWRISAFLHDVRNRVTAEQEIARQKAFLDAVLDNLTEGVSACDAEGRLVLMNASRRRLLQMEAELQLPPRWRDGVLLLDPDGITPIPWHRAPLYRALHGEVVTGEVVVEGRSPTTMRRLVVNARPLRDEHGRSVGALASYRDTTEEAVTAYARHREQRQQPLTGLPNARALHEHLDLASLDPRPAILLLLRVDNYRTTVTAVDQAAVDSLLDEVAQRLLVAAGLRSFVAHIDVDEFAVLAAGGPDEAAALAERVRRAVREPYVVDGTERALSTSAGAAAGSTSGQLLCQARVALQRAMSGRAWLEVFRPEIEAELRDAHSLLDDLERALERQEFTLRYQPQVDLRTGTVHGVEALLRWEHPRRGLVRPDEFVPLAEQTGLILPLGRWVLRTACAQLASWRDAGLPSIRMAVNLSAEQLEARLVDDVAAALAATGLPAAVLELEVTETVAVRQDGAALEVLTSLRQLGVTLSVDDFGTGYSMLGQLRSFPFTQLKIDKSFVQDLDEAGQAPLVVAMIAMARALGLEVVAEGVETPEQLGFLHGEECELAQGYLFARPLEPDDVADLLASDGPLPGFVTAVRRPPPPLADPDELERMVRPLLERLERLTGLESTYLTRVSDGTQEILLARNSGDLEIGQGLSLPWEDTLCSRALVDGAALVRDVPAAFPDVAAATELGIASYAGVPVRTADGELFGTLCGASAGQLDLDPGLRDMLTLYADLLGERITRQGLHDHGPQLGRRGVRPQPAAAGRSGERTGP